MEFRAEKSLIVILWLVILLPWDLLFFSVISLGAITLIVFGLSIVLVVIDDPSVDSLL